MPHFRLLHLLAAGLTALAPAVYLLLRYTVFPSSPDAAGLAAKLTGWYFLLGAALLVASRRAAR